MHLIVNEGKPLTSSLVTVKWCLTPEELETIEQEYDLKHVYVFVVLKGVEGNSQSKHFFPIKQLKGTFRAHRNGLVTLQGYVYAVADKPLCAEQYLRTFDINPQCFDMSHNIAALEDKAIVRVYTASQESEPMYVPYSSPFPELPHWLKSILYRYVAEPTNRCQLVFALLFFTLIGGVLLCLETAARLVWNTLLWWGNFALGDVHGLRSLNPYSKEKDVKFSLMSIVDSLMCGEYAFCQNGWAILALSALILAAFPISLSVGFGIWYYLGAAQSLWSIYGYSLTVIVAIGILWAGVFAAHVIASSRFLFGTVRENLCSESLSFLRTPLRAKLNRLKCILCKPL